MTSRRVRAFIAEGLLLAVLLLLLARAVDPDQLRAGMRGLTGAAVGGVIGFQLTLILMATWSWGILLQGAGIPRSRWHTLRANLGGFAVTYLTPAVLCGGAPVRAALYCGGDARREPVYAAIAVDTFVLAAGKIPTILVGTVLLIVRAPGATALAVGGALLVLVAAIVASLACILRGSGYLVVAARRLVRPLARIRRRPAMKMLAAVRAFAAQLDRIGRDRWSIARALLVAGAVAVVEVMQNFFVLSALGAGSLAGAFAVHAGVLVQGIIGVLPGNLGGMEAANAAAFTLIGLGPATSLLYTLILRAGQLTLVLAGVAVLLVSRLQRGARRTP